MNETTPPAPTDRDPGLDGRVSLILRHPIGIGDVGHATLSPDGPVEAGSWQTFTLVYTAGTYGVDDTGSVKVCFRFAGDYTKPQFADPSGPGYTTVVASNGAVLDVRFDPKGNTRPWDQTVYVKVVRGYLKEGDTITFVFGDKSQGSPGMRAQTFCEDTFEFHVLVDPIATVTHQPVPVQPTFPIVPGPPVRFLAVLPTMRRAGEPFALRVKGEDVWGNPSDRCDVVFRLKASRPVANLPETLALTPGSFAAAAEGLVVEETGDLTIELQAAGVPAVSANPLRIVPAGSDVHYWADLHGQSEETVGTGSATRYFAFARDRAFVDACAHQGNDFQITNQFWEALNGICEAFDEPGRFVTLPGYEWSGNTALGGDRNVFFPEPGRQIRRSSHALLEDTSDVETDATTANALFEAFAEAGEWDVLMYAHCGGRYADIRLAHDGRFEKSVEVHSSWGTFEWLVEDAFEMGYRVGIVANSDGHKGRPGASYPGASMFGAIGGLTCFSMAELTRPALLEAIRKRRHYATSGGPGGRPVIELAATFEGDGTVYHDDPALGPADGRPARTALMGDIVHLPEGDVLLEVDIHAAAPIERVDLFNGRRHLETIRPFGEADLDRRVRVVWTGAEYRGRARQVIWDGTARLEGNRIERVEPINFFNEDKKLERVGADGLAWKALTTGNFGGFDLWTTERSGGTLHIDTPLVKAAVPLERIALEDEIHANDGELPRRIALFRLPTEDAPRTTRFSRKIAIEAGRDNPIYVRLTQADGTLAWTSPIYVFR